MLWNRKHRDHADAGVAAAHGHDKTITEEYGGGNLGAAFFGWLVAVAMTFLLAAIIGAILPALVATVVPGADAQRAAGTMGFEAAIVVVAVLLVGYYAGGYVAGRMSRFDGAKQGMLVWLIGLLLTVIAVVVGMLFESQYNLLDPTARSTMWVATDDVTAEGLAMAGVVLVGTLLAAMGRQGWTPIPRQGGPGHERPAQRCSAAHVNL